MKFEKSVVELKTSLILVGTTLSFNQDQKILSFIKGDLPSDVVSSLMKLRPMGNFNTLSTNEANFMGVDVEILHINLDSIENYYHLNFRSLNSLVEHDHKGIFTMILGIPETNHLNNLYSSKSKFQEKYWVSVDPMIFDKVSFGLNNQALITETDSGEIDYIIPLNSDPNIKFPVLTKVYP